jgi:hypothetical protein
MCGAVDYEEGFTAIPKKIGTESGTVCPLGGFRFPSFSTLYGRRNWQHLPVSPEPRINQRLKAESETKWCAIYCLGSQVPDDSTGNHVRA